MSLLQTGRTCSSGVRFDRTRIETTCSSALTPTAHRRVQHTKAPHWCGLCQGLQLDLVRCALTVVRHRVHGSTAVRAHSGRAFVRAAAARVVAAAAVDHLCGHSIGHSAVPACEAAYRLPSQADSLVLSFRSVKRCGRVKRHSIPIGIVRLQCAVQRQGKAAGWATVGYCAAVDVDRSTCCRSTTACQRSITGVLCYNYCAIVRRSQCFVASLHCTLLQQLLELVAFNALNAS